MCCNILFVMEFPTGSLATKSADPQPCSTLFGRLLHSAPGEERLRSFRDWLQLTLESQLDHLQEHICSLPEQQRDALESWLAGGSYAELVPEDAETPERLLFVTDLETVL